MQILRKESLTNLPVILFGVMVGISGSPLNAAPADVASFYVENYGLADQSEPRVAHAYDVFARMKSAAALPGRQSPDLYIVDTEGDPWAQAIPDGNIILSRKAVEICYQDVNDQLGDARLAFVLGHELAHLAKDDFWHARVHRALVGEPGTEDVVALLEATSDADPEAYAETRAKEAQADDWGMLYAGIAGYPIDTLLGTEASRQDFFSYWLEQTHTRAEHDPRHPLPENRELIIRSRLADVIGNLEYYRFGVRLMSFERFDEARDFLSAYEASFPAPEVMGNLGYLHLRLAINAMPAKLAYRYWMPAVFDVTSRADRLSLPGRGNELSPQARALLERAVDYLDKATAMEADYLPAWINTAVARFYLGDVNLATHAVGEARRLAPDDARLSAMQAVFLANMDPTLDLGPQAIGRLESLIVDGPANPVARYNLARLLEERDDDKSAAAHWDWLRAHAGLLPAPYHRELCDDKPTACQGRPGSDVTNPWKIPAEPGVDLYESPATRELLNGESWRQDEFDFQRAGMRGTLYWRAGRAAVLDLDGYVDMVVLYGDELGTTNELTAELGQPLSVQKVRGGELWRYRGDWVAVIRDERIVEVWVGKQDD